MMITKKDIIQKLYKISENNDINIDSYVQKTIRSENIPIEVIKLINKYDKEFLTIYDTFNVIYSSRNKNPLYRNLKNKNLDINEKAIALSSLMTKILISYGKLKTEEERKVFADAMNIDRLNNALINYMLHNEYNDIINCHQEVSDLLILLYTE